MCICIIPVCLPILVNRANIEHFFSASALDYEISLAKDPCAKNFH